MRALVIGGYGFVGRHLANHLISCGDDVALTYMPERTEAGVRQSPTELQNKVSIPQTAQSLALDVCDSKSVASVVELLKPDVVYHLAAVSHVIKAENQLSEEVLRVNTVGVLNVLDAIVAHSKDSRFLFASSAEVYGEPRPGSLPLTEQSELRPVSAYGVAKAAADLATFKYHHRDGVHTVRARSFPHIGPGQSPSFAISGFARQLAAIKLGKAKPVVEVGNLEPKRDYTDVLDIVRAYREMILNGKPGESYNLCSAASVSIGDVLKQLISIAGVEVEIQVDAERTRSVDISDLYGSAQKAQRDFGWKPRVPRELSLESLFNYWLEALG